MADDRTRAPRVDARGADDIVAETEALLRSLTGESTRPRSKWANAPGSPR